MQRPRVLVAGAAALVVTAAAACGGRSGASSAAPSTAKVDIEDLDHSEVVVK